MRRRLLAVLFFGASAVALVFLVLPVVAIFTRVPPGRLLHLLSSPVVTDALVVSFKATAIAQVLILVLGTPAAYLLATGRFRGRTLLVTLVELPLVLPPAVAGIGLLAALGPRGLLAPLGVKVALSTGAVVIALTFVSAPFYIRQAQAAFGA